MACGAIRRRGCSPPVKLKPRNLRTLGLATALFALLTLSLRRLARNYSMPAINAVTFDLVQRENLELGPEQMP
jgi:hypothetical protein